MLAYELSHLLKAEGPHGYKAEKHASDYNDGCLLAYLAVGYTLVTSDGRNRSACEMGGCKDSVSSTSPRGSTWPRGGSQPALRRAEASTNRVECDRSMSVAVASPPRADPPRLLLDTNVYVDLAEGLLPSEGARLLRIAAHRTPPLVWACEITFDELICHVRQKEESDFPKYRSAFGWMDRLCGNLGMAEDLAWVLHRGVFVGLLPYRGSLPIALNRARREVIKASAFADLRPEFRETVKVLRQEYEGRIQRWVGWRTELHNAARVEPTPGQSGKEGWQLVTEAVREVSRKHIKEDASLWGGFRQMQTRSLPSEKSSASSSRTS